MSLLPKLNNMPKYNLNLPSTGEEITFRPFLVKEEKILLVAMESQDPKQIATAVLDTVKSCLTTDNDVNMFTSYDIEYLFLKIRAKSVGESTKLIFKCQHCQTENTVPINLDSIKIDGQSDNKNKRIKISNEVTLEMKHPSFLSLATSDDVVTTSATHQIFGLIKETVVAVMTEDSRIDMKEVKFDEFQEFLESMTQTQFTKIRDYITSIPKLTHDVKYTCKECKENNELTLEGLQSFL